jgi:outer membrane protein OmpA-like peptidoglycan-associated protein
MWKFVVMLLIMLLPASAIAGDDPAERYRVGVSYGLGNIMGGDEPYFSFNHSWGLTAGISGDNTLLTFSFLSQKNYNDTGATGSFGFFSEKEEALLKFSSLRTGFNFDYRLINSGVYRPTIGIGLGYWIWEYSDPVGDTVVQTSGEHGSTTDFSAAEMYFSGGVGLEIAASQQLAINLRISVDYLTGVGTSFSDSVNDIRERMPVRAGVTLSYCFGGGSDRRPSSEEWTSKPAWSQQKEAVRSTPDPGDSDGDGVENSRDKCPGTPLGALVDKSGCAYDMDGDGVVDGLDDCPQTPRSAAGFVDIFGCPVDSDYDGIPDYRDSCRISPTGAAVDEFGCPLDSDGDGVYDGRDDCPNTAAGVEVDGRGCIDIAFLIDTLRVSIDYQSGSFEIDMRTRERLKPLIRKLQILSDVKVAVYGYTDNVGPAEANQSLSQKRANRMRDWLVTEGIAAERLTAIGKGETNFIAPNQTAEGRALNRRIELIFSH